MIEKSENVICIKDYKIEKCFFKQGEIYKASYDKTRSYNDFYNIRLYENKINFISFDLNSSFNINTIPIYFISLKKQRKEKLDKINRTR